MPLQSLPRSRTGTPGTSIHTIYKPAKESVLLPIKFAQTRKLRVSLIPHKRLFVYKNKILSIHGVAQSDAVNKQCPEFHPRHARTKARSFFSKNLFKKKHHTLQFYNPFILALPDERRH
jgi:hypothetical protein